MDIMGSTAEEITTRIKALAAFAKAAPEGDKELEELEDSHITHALTLNKKKLAAIITTNSPTIANIATLEAYKVRFGYPYGYIIQYTPEHVYYAEVSQIDAILVKGQLAINPACMKKLQL